MTDSNDILSTINRTKELASSLEDLLEDLRDSMPSDVHLEFGTEYNLILRGSETSDVKKAARIRSLSCKNLNWNLRVSKYLTGDGEYQMKFKISSEQTHLASMLAMVFQTTNDPEHLEKIMDESVDCDEYLEKILDKIFDNFDNDTRLNEILNKVLQKNKRVYFRGREDLLSQINDNLCPVLRSAGKFEGSKEDLHRKLCNSIYDQKLDITTVWNPDTDTIILKGSENLDTSPALSSRNRVWRLNVLEEKTQAGEYQMKFEAIPDFVSDVQKLSYPLLHARELDYYHTFLVREVCKNICRNKMGLYPEWGIEDKDALILRGSKTSDVTKIIRMRGLSCNFAHWNLQLLEDTTEDGEYQMKFIDPVADKDRSKENELKDKTAAFKSREHDQTNKAAAFRIRRSLSLPERLTSNQRSLIKEACKSNLDNQLGLTLVWGYNTNSLILRGSKGLDLAKYPIAALEGKTWDWKLMLLDKTTKDGEYQMKFEEIPQRLDVEEYPSVESSSELDDEESPQDIADRMSSVENLLSPLLAIKAPIPCEEELLRELCTSIFEKKLGIYPEWAFENTDALILKGSKTSDAAKISQIKSLRHRSRSWSLKVSEDLTEDDEYLILLMFDPLYG